MDESHSVHTIDSTGISCCYATAGRYTGQLSLITQPELCEQCYKNQAFKIQELNSFEPLRESDFQSELDTHTQRLDERYKLCESCHDIVVQHLKTQAMALKTCQLRNNLQQSKSTPTKLLKRSSSQDPVSLLLAQLACVLLASLLMCSEFLSRDQHTCGETPWFWNTSRIHGSSFFRSFKAANLTSMANYLVFRFATSFGINSRSFLEQCKELLLCLSSLTERRYLHVSLLCLLLNVVVFLKKKTRFGMLILMAWTSLSLLRCCEVFWWKAGCRWRLTGVVFCWFLDASLLLFSVYSRVTRTNKKRYQTTPGRTGLKENHLKIESQIIETDNKAPVGLCGATLSTAGYRAMALEEFGRLSATPSSDKIATDLDWNLNGLSLGLPLKRENGYNTHLSPENSGGKGSFWSQSLSGDSRQSPLVSMRQRPLIVPATLHYSGLRQRSNASHNQEVKSGSPRVEINSCAFSSDEDNGTDSVHEERLTQRSRMYCNKLTSEQKPLRKINRSSLSSKTQTRFVTVWRFLLIASLFLNLYFIFFFTEWPIRLVHFLSKVIKR